jgi:hypothetical protein
LATEIRHFLDSTDQEALFSHVSYQVCRHYQSFFQLLKPSVFRSKPFSDFWLAYQPISNRRHCILKGEIGLSKKVYNDLTKVKVLYSTEALYECLLAGPLAQQGFPAEELLAWMPSVYRTQRLKIHNPALDVLLHAAQRGAHLPASQLACLADLIESNNPTHVAAFLYPAYLDCPFVKKDLCFAGSFTLAQAIHLYRAVLTSSLGHDLWATEAWYTLNEKPKNAVVTPRPTIVVENQLTPEESKDGFKLLFDGTSMKGWKYRRDDGMKSWSVQNGMLCNVLKVDREGNFTEHGTDLLTEEKFKDFVIRYEYQVAPKSNSGLYLRGRHEIQILDDAKTGKSSSTSSSEPQPSSTCSRCSASNRPYGLLSAPRPRRTFSGAASTGTALATRRGLACARTGARSTRCTCRRGRPMRPTSSGRCERRSSPISAATSSTFGST